MEQIRLTGARVLIDLIKPDEKTAAGVVIPDTAKQPTLKGRVVRVGPGTHTENGVLVSPCVAPGDIVLLQAYTGTIVKENGKDFLLINDRDILCCIDETVADKTTVTPDMSALGVTISDKPQ